MLDRTKDKLFHFDIRSFPAAFQQQAAECKAAANGLFATFAPKGREDVARKQMVELVKIMTKEKIDPASLVLVDGPQRKKWDGKHISWNYQEARAHRAARPSPVAVDREAA